MLRGLFLFAGGNFYDGAGYHIAVYKYCTFNVSGVFEEKENTSMGKGEPNITISQGKRTPRHGGPTRMMRWDHINNMIREGEHKSYLEIGYQNGVCFDQIKCEEKYSVDPNGKAMFTGTSDEFFAHCPKKRAFEVVFIDGLHHAEQVEKDIVNSINKVGAEIVVLHDVNPDSFDTQLVPRQTKIWHGDVWRAFVGFRLKYPDAITFCDPDDCGVGIIFVTQKVEPGFITDLSWEEFQENKETYLGFDSHSNPIPNR
jgi:hypothetical protein